MNHYRSIGVFCRKSAIFCRNAPMFFLFSFTIMSTSLLVLLVLFLYFLLLFAVARYGNRGTDGGDNEMFFRAARRAPWPLVAFGMVGASISGVSLISVPGWVATTCMSYLQMCMGFILGYIIVAFVLLPVYYRLRLTSIYGYLEQRFGNRTHRTGALFFLLSKLTGAAARLYVVCMVLHAFVFRPFGLAFPLTVVFVLLLIWLYTRHSGIGAIVRTDALQTFCLLLAVFGILWSVMRQLDFGIVEAWKAVADSPMSQVFVWDPASPQYFWRQFLSGIFIVIVMTGLDQDMMQKNLACASLRDAQKDMCFYGLAFVPVNALFLALGVLLHIFCANHGISVPVRGDDLLPSLVSAGVLGAWVTIPFVLGIISAAFSSADSAIASLTTSLCVDIFRRPADVRLRRWLHVLVVVAFVAVIMVFRALQGGNAIDLIYTMAGYTYGPLLGLFAYGLLTRRPVLDRWVPLVCVFSPVVCAILDHFAPIWWGYCFGYELLMLNGLLTVALLFLFKGSAGSTANVR